jgi:hypothetical protein
MKGPDMPRVSRTPEQRLALLQQQELKLKSRRKAVEERLRRQRERETERNLMSLVQVLKRHGINKLTPERLEKALAVIQ